MTQIFQCLVAFSALLIATASAQEIPAEIQGGWVVSRVIPTRTITCWSQKQADALIGTEIDYTPESLQWKDLVVRHPLVSVSEVTAEQFHDEYSGGGAADSQVDFKQLGIKTDSVKRIVLKHEALRDMGGEFFVPGDEVLIKGPNTIVFSGCNVYFEAHRKPAIGNRQK
jgi:hypothetical protein